MKRNLRGMIVPLVTPFASEDVDFASIRSNVAKYARTRLSGLFVGGSNGESKSLTDQEKLEVLAAVLESRAEHQAVIAGTGHESTRHTVALSKQAEQLGADYVCVLTPSYFKKRLTDEALIGYYNNIADALTIPVLIYNAPGFTGVTISPKVVGAVSRHPNIVGIKDSAPGDGGPYLEVVRLEFLGFFRDHKPTLSGADPRGCWRGSVLGECVPGGLLRSLRKGSIRRFGRCASPPFQVDPAQPQHFRQVRRCRREIRHGSGRLPRWRSEIAFDAPR